MYELRDHYVIIKRNININDKPFQCQNKDYQADDTFGD